VPIELQPGDKENLCRVLGFLDGVTNVYAYLGGGGHFFDLHSEESGIAAVNIRIQFEPHDRHVVDTLRFPIVTPKPTKCSTLARKFFKAIGLGEATIDKLRAEFISYPKASTSKAGTKLPQEFIRLFNVTGFKHWYSFMGTEQHLLELRDHIRSMAQYGPLDAPGISIMQHHVKPTCSVDGKEYKNVHISLNFHTLPRPFHEMFLLTRQAFGALVYTDCLLHVGVGICSFNSAYNVYPARLSEREGLVIGRCSPLAFNHRQSELARKEIGTCMTRGHFDGLTCALARSIFCADPSEVEFKLAGGCGDTDSLEQSFGNCATEIIRFKNMHLEADRQLHRTYGDRIVKDTCVEQDDNMLKRDCSGEAKKRFKALSSSRAHEMHLVCYLCTACGEVMLLDRGYTPVCNYAPKDLKLDVVNLCSWCAMQCCAGDQTLQLVHVPRVNIVATGWQHIKSARDKGAWWI
jgi:hypothetical protein